uniref:Proteasomal ubiquitin receptor ADRM1 homolog n=1 Tax=Strigamia maritima TaxID=126957 RepID=T1ITP4_STRMM
MAIGSARALFGNASSQSQNKNLIEFRAGKMDLKGAMVHPDKRKGLVYVHQTDDSLMHFCWKDRTSGSVVDDLIIFPDDVEFKRVTQCTTGRVYILKFRSTNRKLFFWMQEPKTDKDDECCKKVNDYLNNPPALGANRSSGSTPGGGLPSELSNLGDSEIQTLLNNMSQQQLVQLFGNVGGLGGVSNLTNILSGRTGSAQSRVSSTASPRRETTTPAAVTTPATTTPVATPTTTSAPSAPAANIQLSDLQSILSGIRVPPTEESQARPPIDLSTAVNVDALQPVLNNPDFIQRLQSLIPQVEAGATPETLRETFQSPQFQQAMSMFSAALQSGQLGPLVQQFGLDEAAITAAAQGDMETFVRAMQQSSSAQGGKKPNESGTKGDPKPDKKADDDDDEMALD